MSIYLAKYKTKGRPSYIEIEAVDKLDAIRTANVIKKGLKEIYLRLN